MTAHQNAGTPPDARADRAPLHRGRRRPPVRWIVHGVLFVAQALSLGCYAQLYRRVLAALGARIRFRLAAAVLAVLGYRIVNYWLPLPPGAIAYLRLRLRSGAGSKSKGKGKPQAAQHG
jgi:small-conductance mechanosensitive channel